jgi:hypothetical protein
LVAKTEPLVVSVLVIVNPPVPVFKAKAVAPVKLPTVTFLAFDPVPKLTSPVDPESRVKAELVVLEIVPAPAKVKAVAEVEIVSIEATPVKAPPLETFKPVEAIVKLSLAEPKAIVSAVVSLLPILMVLPAVPVPILIVLALLPVPKLSAPVVPESRVKAEEVVDLIVPSTAKVKAVELVVIVSKEETELTAPELMTIPLIVLLEVAAVMAPAWETAKLPLEVLIKFVPKVPFK